jgi:hypothetical protein
MLTRPVRRVATATFPSPTVHVSSWRKSVSTCPRPHRPGDRMRRRFFLALTVIALALAWAGALADVSAHRPLTCSLADRRRLSDDGWAVFPKNCTRWGTWNTAITKSSTDTRTAIRLPASSPHPSEAGKKESTDRHLSQPCPPCVTPSSTSSCDHCSDARTVEYGSSARDLKKICQSSARVLINLLSDG